MQVVGRRTYRVSRAEFPIDVEIRAQHLVANRAVVGDIRVTRDGQLERQSSPQVVRDDQRQTLTYRIARPAGNLPRDVTQTIDCWFGDNAPGHARYVISITASSGDSFSTRVRVPTVNPGTANLAVQVR